MEILVGTNAPVKHRVFWQGEIVDADSNPTVKLYDITEDPAISPPINPGTLLTTLNSIKLETDQGSYEVYPPLLYTNRPRELKLVWEYQVNGNVVTKSHDLYVIQPYTDLSQAMDALNLGSDYSDPNHKTYQDLLAAERYARKMIENYTQQKFYLYDDIQLAYGAGDDTLPLMYKISELHELTVNDLVLIDNINSINNLGLDVKISESGYGIRLNRANLLDNITYSANGMIPPTVNDISKGIFAKGGAYRVSGKFGWSEIPDAIEIACIELMRDYFSKDKVWRNKYIKSISTFDWQFDYETSTFSGTGNNYVDQLLLPYVLNTMLVI
jgi:hypothetical protein